MSSWDQIRSEVRSFRASVQPTVTTIRDFTFDSKRDRIYFLASDLAKSPKSPMLFYVDLPHEFTQSDNEAEQSNNAPSGAAVDDDHLVEMDTDSDTEHGNEGTTRLSDSDMTVVIVTASGGDTVPGTCRIRAKSDRHSPSSWQADGSEEDDDDEDLGLVPFDPNTYQFVELAHQPRCLTGVVGSYPRESTTVPPPISSSSPSPPPPPPPSSSSSFSSNQMDQDIPPAIEALNDMAIEDILRAAPVLEWVPVLSEEWIKEHHAAYMLSRSDLHRHSDGPPRIAAGITQYQFEPLSNRLLFPYGDDIYLADIPEKGRIHPEPVVHPAGLTEDHTEGSGSGNGAGGVGAAAGGSSHVRMDPKLGGTGMNLIAFTRSRDLWVMTTTGVETQLTFCSRNKSNTAISCGIAEFIMQEEFHRYTNYYWAPQSSHISRPGIPPLLTSMNGAAANATSGNTSLSSSNSSINSNNIGAHRHSDAPLPVVTPKGLQTRPRERILYLQVSEAMVDVVMIPRQGPEIEEYRYPHAGTPNAASDIQIVEFVPKQHQDDIVPEPLHKRLWGRCSIYKLCPWLEYIVRFGWMPDGDCVWAQILDRRQQLSALVMIPLDCFQSVTEHANSTPKAEEELADKMKIIYEEQSEYWINVTDILYIFPSSDTSHSTTAHSRGYGNTTRCIVASERTGFRHLYLLTYNPGESGSSIVPITSGDYQVVDKPISVDPERQLVYFTAKRDTVLESHLYVASFAEGADPKRHIKRLTHLGYSHQVTMDLTRNRFLTLFSSIEQSPACSVMHLRWDECKLKRAKQQRQQDRKNQKSDLQQEDKRTRLTGAATANERWQTWCDCGCHFPKISSYALSLREGIRNRSAKEVRDHPVVPRPPEPPRIANGNGDGSGGGGPLVRASGQDGLLGTNGTIALSTGDGSGNSASTSSNSVRPRKSLSGFLASHLLSPGILQAPKFGSLSDSSLVISTTASASTSSSRARTKSAPRLGGVFSSSSSQSTSSSWNSASSSGIGGVGSGGPTSPSSPSSTSGIGLAVNANHHPAGEFFTYQSSDGVILHGCLYRPANYVPGTKYPTLVSIYGGPKSQMVTNEYKLPKFLRVFLATRMGYAVVMFDGRGSNERGIEFEGRLRHRMGQVEIQDQVEGLQFLARPENGGIVDMDRVAISGWSYGGYLSLMALVQYPEVFKLAIAGAPVTQWELYNSAYTERYMGLLSENKEGYTKSNVLSYVEKFPDSENRLLIAHGLIDENVHFKNTETLSAELIRLNKPHHIQLYPTERHGLRDVRVNEHFETLMFYWLRNYL
ncbi:dipeptidylpeptidase [Actinomortierella wolfii]|nr:dipeptidylpeptidase [Actinomortierella wolfii]